jgi:acetoin:2,6-dichlorophenolindophenol oxidoreductase subunit beta
MSTVLESLNAGLHRAFASDERVYLLGEDILDPYGGAFKVSRGLSSAYPQRVLTTPISEAGITGVAAGMALRGLRLVVEIMFGDFITLAADQIINHIAKFRWMYNDQVALPLVLRTPMGGRRGYGPTHSQTLEKHFLGVPGLTVLAPCALQYQEAGKIFGPGELLEQRILYAQEPALFIENKLLYLQRVAGQPDLADFDFRCSLQAADPLAAPAFTLSVKGAPSPSLTLSAYGYMAELSRQAVLDLAYEHEVFCELVVVTQLAPFDLAPVLASVRRTGRLLTIEEGSQALGWGAEVLAQAAEAWGPGLLRATRQAALNLPVPASAPLEQAVFPGVESIKRAVLSMV